MAKTSEAPMPRSDSEYPRTAPLPESGTIGSAVDVGRGAAWSTAIKSRIVKIGYSQSVRIPKLLLEQSDLGEEVELVLEWARGEVCDHIGVLEFGISGWQNCRI